MRLGDEDNRCELTGRDTFVSLTDTNAPTRRAILLKPKGNQLGIIIYGIEKGLAMTSVDGISISKSHSLASALFASKKLPHSRFLLIVS